MQIVIIGGGAAGFFGAVNIARMLPDAKVTILEKSSKLLSKVRVSGGGRCNVTHACFDDGILIKNYPRGEKQLRSAFSRFSVKDTIDWYSKRGVDLKTEDDGRMFPTTDNSASIVECLMKEAEKLKVNIKMNCGVSEIVKFEDGFNLLLENSGKIYADKILIATGGNAKETAYDWLKKLGHSIERPVPSLFTFNIPSDPIKELMGVSVEQARIKIAGTKLETQGPLLITHWGMSGPAVLRLSSVGARTLNDMNYEFNFFVNWLPDLTQEKLNLELNDLRKELSVKTIITSKPFELPKRLWEYLAIKTGISKEQRWADLSNKQLNKLITVLLFDEYKVKGKTTFKEEFVTCGGINLKEVEFKTMESKIVPGLFFAGEVLDIDGITGGFNFQSAWSTSYIASTGMCL